MRSSCHLAPNPGAPVEFYSLTYEPKAKAAAFLAKHPMRTVVGLDDDLKTFTSFIAWGIPMSYVIDGNERSRLSSIRRS